MLNSIKTYPVKNQLLKKYIKFFWECRANNSQLNHKLIPQRNINLRFNLSETPHFLSLNNQEHKLERVYFSGLHDCFTDAHLKLSGEIHTFGICFFPEGFYPFIKIPIAEFKNRILGLGEIGFKMGEIIWEKLSGANDITERLDIIEKELLSFVIDDSKDSDNFINIFKTLVKRDNSLQISEFCKFNNINIRTLERMYNKYVGLSANTYRTLDRFHFGLNNILYGDYSKYSDVAYDSGYFDQMHFIRDFKRFTGATPKSFAKQNDSLLQIAKLK